MNPDGQPLHEWSSGDESAPPRDQSGNSTLAPSSSPRGGRYPGAFFHLRREGPAVTPVSMPEGDVPAPWITRKWLTLLGIRHAYRIPVTPPDRRRVIAALYHEGSRLPAFVRRFTTLMALSVAIAALGLLADSTAVVIGAMLVAPLLAPVLGIAASLVMGWPRRVLSQAINVTLAAVGAVALAYAISLVVPGRSVSLPAELLARTSPNLLDAGIALAAGAAGAYGIVRREASDALPGVAIAVALVPPLAAIGISLQLAEWQLALGACFLFLTNISAIVFSGAVTFIMVGFVPGQRLLSGNLPIAAGLRWAALAVIVVIIPIQAGRGRILPPTDNTEEVAAAVQDFVGGETSPVEVVEVTVDVKPEETEVEVVMASPYKPPPVAALAAFLADELERKVDVRLQVVESDRSRATVPEPTG